MKEGQTIGHSLRNPQPVSERAWLAQELVMLRSLSSAGETTCSLAARMRRSEQSIVMKLAS